jgi:hypothetical protein
VWLPWQDALWLALGLVALLVLFRNVTGRVARVAHLTGKELVHVLVLYAIWQWVGQMAKTKTAGAREHALWIWDLQQALHLPSELALQNALIDHRPIMWFLNVFYGGAHVPAMALTLIWLFFRHRGRYPAVRTTLALLTACCIAIQTIPVAPPRFFPELGFVDAGLVYNLSVYGHGGSGISNQLAAMPSLHVGWAVLVAAAVIRVSTSRYRWWILLHPALTLLAVTATANHWWLDGVAAVAVLGAVVGLRRGALAARAAWAGRGRVLIPAT